MKICLDPGHGMGNRKPCVYDPGAEGNGSTEAAIVLEWALTGKFVLPQSDIEVFLTRDDKYVSCPIGSRDNQAKLAGCTHFISIHCNAFNGKATGVEAFYRDTTDKAFASVVLDCLVKATGLPSRGLKNEGQSQHSRLAVLDFAPPACLIEIGFIDNPKDHKIITSRETRLKFFTLLAEKIK